MLYFSIAFFLGRQPEVRVVCAVLTQGADHGVPGDVQITIMPTSPNPGPHDLAPSVRARCSFRVRVRYVEEYATIAWSMVCGVHAVVVVERVCT